MKTGTCLETPRFWTTNQNKHVGIRVCWILLKICLRIKKQKIRRPPAWRTCARRAEASQTWKHVDSLVETTLLAEWVRRTKTAIPFVLFCLLVVFGLCFFSIVFFFLKKDYCPCCFSFCMFVLICFECCFCFLILWLCLVLLSILCFVLFVFAAFVFSAFECFLFVFMSSYPSVHFLQQHETNATFPLNKTRNNPNPTRILEWIA